MDQQSWQPQKPHAKAKIQIFQGQRSGGAEVALGHIPCPCLRGSCGSAEQPSWLWLPPGESLGSSPICPFTHRPCLELFFAHYASPLNDAPCRSSSSKIPYGPLPLLPGQAYFFKAHIPAGDFGCPLISLWVLRLTRGIYAGRGRGRGEDSHPEWILS